MVYCSKCGTKNPDDTDVCSKCGAALYVTEERKERKEHVRAEKECFGTERAAEPYKRVEEECFGIPRGGTIVALAIGLIIILWGSIWFLQQADVISGAVEVWPFAVVIFGILIIVGALYGLRRRY